MTDEKSSSLDDVSRSFTEGLLRDVKRNQQHLIVAMVDAAKKGDTGLLREIIKQVSSMENKNADEIKFSLTDDQFKQVIIAAARRIQARPVSEGRE